jgi:tetratricopeptide (TPR) repeat protein
MSVDFRIVLVAGILWSSLPARPGQIPADALDRSRQAAGLIQAGDPEAAIPIYKELARAFPSEASFRINLAIAEFKTGRYRATIDDCSALLHAQPGLFPAWLFLGASYLKLGEYARAEEALQKAVSIQPGDVNARLMLAQALQAQEKYAEAAESYGKAAEQMPGSPAVWLGLARAYEGLTATALGRLQQSAPASAEFAALSGEFALEKGQLAAAFQSYRRALALDPGFPGVHREIAGIYRLSGHADWAEVEQALEAATPPDCTKQPLACGYAAGRFQEVAIAQAGTPAAAYWQVKALHELSRQAYARLKALPPSRESYEAEAVAQERSARYREAAEAWKQASRLAPGDAAVERSLVLALCHSNDCHSALPIVDALLKQQPLSAELNYLYGLALSETSDFAQALPFLEAAVQLDPTLLPAQAALGVAYLETGKADRAIPHLEAAAKKDEDGRRHYRLARAYQAAGNREAAAPVLEEYRRIQARRQLEAANEPRITPPQPNSPARGL